MRTWKKLVTGALAAAALLIVACSPGEVVDPGNGGGSTGGTGIALSVDVIQNISNAAQQDVVLNWIPGPDDGYGVVDGFRATATDSLGAADTAFVAEPGRTQTFTFGPWAINTVVSGAACVRAERRSLASAFVCTGWSASVDDQAPPTPIIDSVVGASAAAGGAFDITVTAYYRLSPDDGGGAYTLDMYARDGETPRIDSASVGMAVVPGSQAIVLNGYTYGQTYNGQACVTATRRALFSQACASFVGLVVDQPPPPPILPVGLSVVPETFRLATAFPACTADTVKIDANGYPTAECTTLDSLGQPIAAVQQMCAMFLQSDGKYYMLSGQEGLGYCQTQYDALPDSTRLPGYPTASVRYWTNDGAQWALRVNTRKEELASVVFEGPFKQDVNVFAYAQQQKLWRAPDVVTVTPKGVTKG